MTNVTPCETPLHLAQLWWFHCTRRRCRLPADTVDDVFPEFENMVVNLGFTVGELEAAILKQGRDRGEYLWQFKDRMKKGRQTSAETQEQRQDRQAREREDRRKKRAKLEELAATPEQLSEILARRNKT